MGEVDTYRLGHTFIQIYRPPAIKKVKFVHFIFICIGSFNEHRVKLAE
jgi:hypothetical protein